MQAPNYGAEAAALDRSLQSHDVPPSDQFARDANDYIRQLRTVYFDRLRANDDNGVFVAAESAKIVEHAACVHASARSLAGIRARASTSSDAVNELTQQKEYLRGIQTRLALALANRDISALDRISNAADAAMQHLAHPDEAFADLEGRAQLDRELERRAVHVDRQLGNTAGAGYDDQFVRDMEQNRDGSENHFAESASGGLSRTRNSSNSNGEKKRKCTFSGFSYRKLSTKDKYVFVVYLIMLICAAVSVGFITAHFIESSMNPESFIGSIVESKLKTPVVTICLSRAGIPLSRLQVFNFTDANGDHFVVSDPKGRHKDRKSENFDSVVERFFHKPESSTENCDETVGDFFPFNVEALNALANGSKSSQCQPCFRFGNLKPILTNRTDFEQSSFLSIFTDNYALECLTNPGGLTKPSIEFLHEFIEKNVKNKMQDTQTLVRGDGQLFNTTTRAEINLLDSKQLCNAFYFGFFPKGTKAIPKNDPRVKYTLRNNQWVFEGTQPEFIPPPPPKVKRGKADFFPMESIRFFASHDNSSIEHVRDSLLVGPNTVSFSSIMH